MFEVLKIQEKHRFFKNFFCPEWSLPGITTSQAQELWVTKSLVVRSWDPGWASDIKQQHLELHAAIFCSLSANMRIAIKLFCHQCFYWILFLIYCLIVDICLCSFILLYSLLMCRFYYDYDYYYYYCCYEDLLKVSFLCGRRCRLPAWFSVTVCFCTLLTLNVCFSFPVTCWLLYFFFFLHFAVKVKCWRSTSIGPKEMTPSPPHTHRLPFGL